MPPWRWPRSSRRPTATIGWRSPATSSACGRRPTTASRSSRCTPPPTRPPTPDFQAFRRSCAAAPPPARATVGTSVRSSMPARAAAQPSPNSNEARRRCGCGSTRTTTSTRRRSTSCSKASVFDVAPVILDAGPQWSDAARALRAIWERAGVDRGRCAWILRRRPVRRLGRRPRHKPTRRRPASPVERGLRPSPPSTPTWAWRRSTGRVSTMPGRPTPKSSATPSPSCVATLRTLTDGGLDVAAAFAQLEVRLAAHRRPVRHDRQVPRRSPPAGTRRRGLRRADRRRWRPTARRHVTGDDDPLRPCRQHRARRRSHASPLLSAAPMPSPCCPTTPSFDDRPSEFGDAAWPATRKRCSAWSRTWPG